MGWLVSKLASGHVVADLLSIFPLRFPMPWALIRRSNERCVHAVYYSPGAAAQSLVNISLFPDSTGLLRALFLFRLFSTCI